LAVNKFGVRRICHAIRWFDYEDTWPQMQRREATGDMIILRYADDFIVGCQHESGARPFLDAMREGIG
jgi:hypothetical protein